MKFDYLMSPAARYHNEPEVGEALAEAFQTGLMLRERERGGVGTIVGVLDEDKLLDIDTIHMEDLVSMGLVRGIGIRILRYEIQQECGADCSPMVNSRDRKRISKFSTSSFTKEDMDLIKIVDKKL
ncbi:hypothetical protein TorRG33x02_043540 [Trema orientale]|uniref:Uncharacterized protein n=1 Tax=Trema orientale TaxID=63057 RepID=A0A2P5FQ78_TREOI|nr:hypothetical protein TorRG33x02_043540 [Trema orientale]